MRRLPFSLAVAVSVVVLFSPGSDVPTGIPVNDKVVHAALFGVLALTGRVAGIGARALAIVLVAYAGASEVLQGALPIQRDADWRDALADVVGVAVGLVLAAGLARRRRLS